MKLKKLIKLFPENTLLDLVSIDDETSLMLHRTGRIAALYKNKDKDIFLEAEVLSAKLTYAKKNNEPVMHVFLGVEIRQE